MESTESAIKKQPIKWYERGVGWGQMATGGWKKAHGDYWDAEDRKNSTVPPG